MLAAGLLLILGIWSGWFDRHLPIDPHVRRTFLFDVGSIGFALCLPAAAALRRLPRLPAAVIAAISTQSYAIYIVHLSVLEIVGACQGPLARADLARRRVFPGADLGVVLGFVALDRGAHPGAPPLSDAAPCQVACRSTNRGSGTMSAGTATTTRHDGTSPGEFLRAGRGPAAAAATARGVRRCEPVRPPGRDRRDEAGGAVPHPPAASAGRRGARPADHAPGDPHPGDRDRRRRRGC